MLSTKFELIRNNVQTKKKDKKEPFHTVYIYNFFAFHCGVNYLLSAFDVQFWKNWLKYYVLEKDVTDANHDTCINDVDMRTHSWADTTKLIIQ